MSLLSGQLEHTTLTALLSVIKASQPGWRLGKFEGTCTSFLHKIGNHVCGINIVFDVGPRSGSRGQ